MASPNGRGDFIYWLKLKCVVLKKNNLVVFGEMLTKLNGGGLYEKLTASTQNLTSASTFV